MLPIQNIGLAGRAGSGKGVLAAELGKRGYAVVSFAGPIKRDIARLVFGNARMCDLQHVEDNKATLRPLLQAYGVAMRDIAGADVWVNLALWDVRSLNAAGYPVVIDDVRFPNEVAALKAAGFVVFGIDRPHWHRTLYGGNTLTGDQATHSSEAQIDDLPVDCTLVNDGTTALLFQRLAYAFNANWLPDAPDWENLYAGVKRVRRPV